MRLDADTGALVQQYRLAGRLDNCRPIANTVGASDDLYLLLQCWDDSWNWDGTRVLLHAMSPAGRVRCEVLLAGWSFR